MASPPVARVLSKLPDAKPRPSGGWSAKCPVHNGQGETSRSLDEGDDGRALLTCFAGCSVDPIVAALGLDKSDRFARQNAHARPPSITLAELAKARRLLAAWLANALGWHDLPGGGVGLPYRDAMGHTLQVKRRTALNARDGSFWPKGVPLMPSGLEHLEAAHRRGTLILVEGETDTATLRSHGFPVLGLPGADSAKVLHAAQHEGITRLYVWQEPDGGVRPLSRASAGAWRRSGIQGRPR